jgi:hypothetical protein
MVSWKFQPWSQYPTHASHMHERGGARIRLRFGIKGGKTPQKPQLRIRLEFQFSK